MNSDLLAELRWRGLLHQTTHDESLHRHLGKEIRLGYAGFDPTADSLTIGNLVPIMVLAHLQRAGHKPVVLVGGGTGLIGDPSGKTAERTLMTAETIERNVACQRRIFESFLALGDAPTDALILNNAEWLTKLGFIEALRDIGKHFSVNAMIQRDSVRDRLENREQGISYTEFSYMLLQAYDFAHLHDTLGVTLELGGSDQWGNIVAGTELIRKRATSEGQEAPEVFGLTAPLVTKADGGKFGKTESGAIWLTAERTSPYAYYQFWLNAADEDVERFLKIFTFHTQDEIAGFMAEAADNPGARVPQRALARAATSLLHGEAAMENAEAAGRAMFSGDFSGLDEATLREVFAELPSSEYPRAELDAGVPLMGFLKDTTLAKSNSEARQHLSAGSISVNGEKVDTERALTPDDLLPGGVIALRRGKKAWHVTRWV